jgi:hypothetical protein
VSPKRTPKPANDRETIASAKTKQDINFITVISDQPKYTSSTNRETIVTVVVSKSNHIIFLHENAGIDFVIVMPAEMVRDKREGDYAFAEHDFRLRSFHCEYMVLMYSATCCVTGALSLMGIEKM